MEAFYIQLRPNSTEYLQYFDRNSELNVAIFVSNGEEIYFPYYDVFINVVSVNNIIKYLKTCTPIPGYNKAGRTIFEMEKSQTVISLKIFKELLERDGLSCIFKPYDYKIVKATYPDSAKFFNYLESNVRIPTESQKIAVVRKELIEIRNRIDKLLENL